MQDVVDKIQDKVLKTTQCGYRDFDTVFDASLWEHLHPNIPSAICEPLELRMAGEHAKCAGRVEPACPPDPHSHAHRIPASLVGRLT